MDQSIPSLRIRIPKFWYSFYQNELTPTYVCRSVCRMNGQLAIQKLLRRKLAEIQVKNPSFSVRAFAKRLGFHPSAANEILKGERQVSRKLAEKIMSRLHLDPTERSDILKLFPVKRILRSSFDENEVSPEQSLKLSSDQFHAISDWVHFAILSLVRTQEYEKISVKHMVEWISERLNVSEKQTLHALERLERLSLIEKRTDGKFNRIAKLLNTTDDVQDLSLQKSHLADMELARDALLHLPIEVRDFSALMFPVDPELLPRAKEILRKAQDEVAALLGSQPTSEVYRLSTYLFPVTKIKSKKKEK